MILLLMCVCSETVVFVIQSVALGSSILPPPSRLLHFSEFIPTQGRSPVMKPHPSLCAFLFTNPGTVLPLTNDQGQIGQQQQLCPTERKQLSDIHTLSPTPLNSLP